MNKRVPMEKKCVYGEGEGILRMGVSMEKWWAIKKSTIMQEGVYMEMVCVYGERVYL